RHTRFSRDWSSDVCSSDLVLPGRGRLGRGAGLAGFGLAALGRGPRTGPVFAGAGPGLGRRGVALRRAGTLRHGGAVGGHAGLRAGVGVGVRVGIVVRRGRRVRTLALLLGRPAGTLGTTAGPLRRAVGSLRRTGSLGGLAGLLLRRSTGTGRLN